MSVAKEASITVYLMEELGDARLRCDQLLRGLADVVKLVEQSNQRDHLFEVAGHLIRSIPETAFKLQKALQAVALAADRLDYEELKQDLRPEKVEELENVLQDVRIRPVQHRSQPPGVQMKASQELRSIAKEARETGYFPVESLVSLINRLSPDRAKQASIQLDPAEVVERIAATLDSPAEYSRVQLVDVLTKLAKDVAFTQGLKQADELPSEASLLTATYDRLFEIVKVGRRAIGVGNLRMALSSLGLSLDEIATFLVHLGSIDAPTKADILRREIQKVRLSNPPKLARFEEGVPADPTVNMTPEDAETWDGYTEEYGDKFKTAAKGDPVWLKARFPGKDVDGKDFKKGDDVLYWPSSKKFMTGAKADAAWKKFEAEIADEAFSSRNAFGDDVMSRYEEGVPADPTENMDPDDAEAWKDNTEEYGDKFKTAAGEHRDSAALSKQMKDVVDSILTNRVKVRNLYHTLGSLNRDATGIFYTDNYRNPEIQKVMDVLSNIETASGGFDLLERFMVRTFPKLVKTAASFEDRVASYMSRWADSSMPSPEEQLKLMKSHPPTMKEEGEFYVIKLFSPITKKYVPQGGHRKEEVAEKDLKSWEEAHRESIRRLEKQVSRAVNAADEALEWKVS